LTMGDLMKLIRSIIVDDEELSRKCVRLALAEEEDVEIVGECANGKEAIRDIIRLKPDLVFLDIQMPEINGFDVLKSIGRDDLPFVIFITAYDEYAIKAFEVHAIDYILKPFSKSRFRKTLEHARNVIEEKDATKIGESLLNLVSDWENKKAFISGINSASFGDYLDRIFVSERDSHKIVWVKDIEWIEGADYYVNLHCSAKSYLYRERLKNLEVRLPNSSFIRVHKSAIINLDRLDRIITDYKNDYYAVMKSGKQVKISKARKKDLFDICERNFRS
jgi:two-component system LytT family response regulator